MKVLQHRGILLFNQIRYFFYFFIFYANNFQHITTSILYKRMLKILIAFPKSLLYPRGWHHQNLGFTVCNHVLSTEDSSVNPTLIGNSLRVLFSADLLSISHSSDASIHALRCHGIISPYLSASARCFYTTLTENEVLPVLVDFN